MQVSTSYRQIVFSVATMDLAGIQQVAYSRIATVTPSLNGTIVVNQSSDV